jgi:hypothetical protein
VQRVVTRIGVSGETVTLRQQGALIGCDNSAGSREGDRRWCGESFGRLYGGRLRDPRLDIAGCSTADGDPVAFAWVEPARNAHYVVVEQPGYDEVYEVGGDVPVRVASVNGIESEPLGATFQVSEHARDGALLRRYRLEARPAG